MKKIIMTVLAFALIFSLCACCFNVPVQNNPVDYNGGFDSVDIAPDVEDTEPIEVEIDSSIIGAYSGLTYENAYIGIGCNLPGGWIYYSDAQLRELNNIAMELSSEEVLEILEESEIYYDMFAIDSSGTNNIIVNMEKVDPIQLAMLDTQKNLEDLIPAMKASYEEMGATGSNMYVGTMTIDGEELACLSIMAELAGTVLYQYVFAIKCEDHLASVSLTATDQQTLAEMLNMLYVLN